MPVSDLTLCIYLNKEECNIIFYNDIDRSERERHDTTYAELVKKYRRYLNVSRREKPSIATSIDPAIDRANTPRASPASEEAETTFATPFSAKGERERERRGSAKRSRGTAADSETERLRQLGETVGAHCV